VDVAVDVRKGLCAEQVASAIAAGTVQVTLTTPAKLSTPVNVSVVVPGCPGAEIVILGIGALML
jgi:hypothetical protein